ncbi:MAG: GvpL/GvpF family gas vesicle protein [Candidatus Wallbacteria bacterium]|nr:GvpL/GvpF family gas vesicle protein [Candidatus Wallbacteria bacterium]
MEKEGKYIYCIIATSQERNFGPIGVGGRGDDVLTINYNDLSMVVSSHPLIKFVVGRENILTHERVIEEVMKEFGAVLPVRFGTIASDAEEIRNLLDRRYREFKTALMEADHKIELGVKGVWKDMGIIYQEIIDENKVIKKAKEEIESTNLKSNQAKLEVGKKVEKALSIKKRKEAENVVDTLRIAATDYRLNQPIGDEMFINAAFLVGKGREKEFDNIMDELSEKYQERTKFLYVGPLPIFNFVNIVIYPEEWEK